MRLALVALLAGCPGNVPTDPTATDPPTPEPLNDPISMPLEPTVDLGDFQGAASCEGCHEEHVQEWSTSMHAYAMVDPLFRAIVEVRQADLNGAEDRFCVQCHSAIGTRSGSLDIGFSFDDQPAIVTEGITCVSCHKITSVERPWNAGHAIDPLAPMQGPSGTPSPIHEVSQSAVFQDSVLCGSCHDVIETSGLPLERPYAEWLESPAAAAGTTCQDCHMPPTEDGRHSHRFVGVDLPLVDGFVDEATRADLQLRIEELLAGSADLELDVFDVAPGQTASAVVTVHNLIEGHAFPTGSTFIREAWVELVARADGEVFYETGTLDANGDLRNYWSELEPYGDHDLISFASNFTDAAGAPTVFSWRAADHTSRAISPGYPRTSTLFLPVPEGAQEVTVEARLRFRAIPPYLLRLVGLDAYAVDLPVYDIDTASWVQVGP
ncbi:MAG: hypothetical protein H6734_08965 [Alphaproteobacteria bacterium]|nr:hypothetical protein [Alphaproteobacteria bacterium]